MAVARVGARTCALAVVVATSACAAIAGLESPADEAAAGDAAMPPRSAGNDAGDGEGFGGASDAPAKECSRGGSAVLSPTAVRVERTEQVIAVDGDAADWRCTDRFRVDGTVGYATASMAPESVADVAMQVDDGNLYVWAKVKIVAPSESGEDIAKNDSFSVYVTAPDPTAAFRPNDRRWVFDVFGRVAEYAGNSVRSGAEVARSVEWKTTAADGRDTFEIEMRIPAEAVGRTRFDHRETVRVNFQINDSTPGATLAYRVWYRGTGCNCGTEPNGGPSCNLQCTGAAVLD